MPVVLLCWDMDKLKVEEQDGSDPVIDCRVRLYIWVVKHPADIKGIHLYNKFADANKVEVHRTEHMEEAIKFNLGLGVVGLTLVLGNGAKVCGAAASVGAVLREDLSNTLDR